MSSLGDNRCVEELSTVSEGHEPLPLPRVVLHVSDTFTSGVRSAIEQYIAATPEVSHALLVGRHRSLATVVGDPLDSVVHTPLPPGHVAAVRALVDAVRVTQPDVVHAHSSYAGTYLAVAQPWLSRPRPRLVYTPHGFAFTRRDLPLLARLLAVTAEIARGLVSNASTAAVGEHEAQLARRLSPHRSIHVVPHAPSVEPFWKSNGVRDQFQVVLAGRVSAQKDPRFLLEMLRSTAHDIRAGLHVTWLGDGDDDLVRELRDAGVTVTGWLQPSEVLARYAEADLYLHCAAWEGEPMTLIEAVLAGIPAIARSIPALRPLSPRIRLFKDAGEGARLLNWCVEERDRAQRELTAHYADLRPHYSKCRQRTELRAAWHARGG